jgi:hypothetical protein
MENLGGACYYSATNPLRNSPYQQNTRLLAFIGFIGVWPSMVLLGARGQGAVPGFRE